MRCSAARNPATSRRAPLSPDEPLGGTRSASRRESGVRQGLRRGVLPRLLLGQLRAFDGAGGHVPRAVSQRRGFALHLSGLGRDRAGGVDQRRALRRQPQRAEVPPELRPCLLVPAPRRELGRGARRRRGQARPRIRRATSTSRGEVDRMSRPKADPKAKPRSAAIDTDGGRQAGDAERRRAASTR